MTLTVNFLEFSILDKLEINKRVLKILEKKKPIPLEDLIEKLDYRYLDEGHVDSFSILNIIMELETEFNIDLTAEDTESDNFRTPGGIVKIIETK